MKMGMCEGLWQSGTRCCQLHWVWGGEGERSCVWVGPRLRVPLWMRKQPRNLPKIKNILEETETLQDACVVSLYALNCPHSSQATWLHTCKEVEAQGWLLKVHRVWIWIWTQAYVPSPFYLSQPLMMYCTSVSISRRLCTYLGNCSYPAVVKSNFKELWMDCPCDRWWFHSVSGRSAWPACTRWNNLVSLCIPLWLYCVRWKLPGVTVGLLSCYNQALQAMRLIALCFCWRPVLSKERDCQIVWRRWVTTPLCNLLNLCLCLKAKLCLYKK